MQQWCCFASLLICSIAARQPNIVLLLTDDQDLLFDSTTMAMPFTKELLGAGGTSFSNAFAHTPVCCPSRGQVLTGKYMHNLRAPDADISTCMRCLIDDEFEAAVFARSLQRAGYQTGMIGKYLNGRIASHCPPEGSTERVEPPPGWDRYFAMCPDQCYEDCAFADQGHLRVFADTSYAQGSNYATSVIGNETVAFVEQSLRSGKPFFAYVSPHSPHSPATPAPWHANRFQGVKAPRTESFNVAAPCHHFGVAVQPPINFVEEVMIDDLARRRLQTLLPVDDLVRGVYAAVKAHSALDRTYFIFTSDHGFHMGQHRLNHGKRMPYDTDLRIPLLVAGPGVAAGRTVSHLVGLPDLAPTILDLAGVQSGVLASTADKLSHGEMDGQSFAPLLLSQSSTAKRPALSTHPSAMTYLVEYIATQQEVKTNLWGRVGDAGNSTFRGLRFIDPAGGAGAGGGSVDVAYFEFTDPYDDWAFSGAPSFCMLFDLTTDPDQMLNLYVQGRDYSGDPLVSGLSARLRKQFACKGPTCRDESDTDQALTLHSLAAHASKRLGILDRTHLHHHHQPLRLGGVDGSASDSCVGRPYPIYADHMTRLLRAVAALVLVAVAAALWRKRRKEAAAEKAAVKAVRAAAAGAADATDLATGGKLTKAGSGIQELEGDEAAPCLHLQEKSPEEKSWTERLGDSWTWTGVRLRARSEGVEHGTYELGDMAMDNEGDDGGCSPLSPLL